MRRETTEHPLGFFLHQYPTLCQGIGVALEHMTAQARDLLRRTALTGFQAVCEALYPDNNLGAPSWRDAEMVDRAAILWDELPPESALLLQTLYASLELGGALLAPSLGPLSKLPIDRRLTLLKRWKAGLFPFRFLAEAIKSSSTMVYMSHPAVSAYIGESRACGSTALHGRPVKENAFAGLLPRAEKKFSSGGPR